MSVIQIKKHAEQKQIASATIFVVYDKQRCHSSFKKNLDGALKT